MATAFEKLKQKSVQTTAPAPTASVSAFDALKTKETATPVSQETEKKDGVIKTFVKDIARPVLTLGARPIQAVAALGGATANQIDEATKKIAGDLVAPTPRNATDVVKDVGRAAETISYGLGGAAVKTGVKTALKETIKQAVKRGAIEGAKAGGMFGAGEAVEESGNLVDAVEGGVKGAIGGAIGGAVIPAVAGKAKSVFGRRAAEKAEQVALVESKTPDARVATKKITPDGKIVTDKVAKEAVRQGVEEADVALIKSGSVTDKSKMKKMFDIRENQLVNKRTTDRATDVVGDTYINNTAKFLEKKNREARKNLDLVANRLAGKKVDVTDALSDFASQLDNAGITLGNRNSLNFKNSVFRNVPSVQNDLGKFWREAVRVARLGDARQVHILKKSIDEIVEYGAEGLGMKGSVANMLKSLRHNLDGTLDKKFAQYNKVNTQYAETIGEMQKIAALMGKKFRVGDNFADARMGLILRRILGNTQSRSEILRLLESSQNMARKYGAKIDEDVITQANFADLLEKTLGSEAPTSFLGQGERFTSKLQEIIQAPNLAGSAIKATQFAAETARGISQENKRKALRALLENEMIPTPKVSNFGRPKQ